MVRTGRSRSNSGKFSNQTVNQVPLPCGCENPQHDCVALTPSVQNSPRRLILARAPETGCTPAFPEGKRRGGERTTLLGTSEAQPRRREGSLARFDRRLRGNRRRWRRASGLKAAAPSLRPRRPPSAHLGPCARAPPGVSRRRGGRGAQGPLTPGPPARPGPAQHVPPRAPGAPGPCWPHGE